MATTEALRPHSGVVVGVDRFVAEIEVTANLQHPDLLPVFDSGAARELLFYVMPHVQGESLARDSTAGEGARVRGVASLADGELSAVPFDPRSRTVTGRPVIDLTPSPNSR